MYVLEIRNFNLDLSNKSVFMKIHSLIYSSYNIDYIKKYDPIKHILNFFNEIKTTKRIKCIESYDLCFINNLSTIFYLLQSLNVSVKMDSCFYIGDSDLIFNLQNYEERCNKCKGCGTIYTKKNNNSYYSRTNCPKCENGIIDWITSIKK